MPHNTHVIFSLPQDRQDMRSMFRVCATERLFIPDMFPAMDRAIYIDTDLIFLRWVGSRAGNEPSRRLNFYNHREGPNSLLKVPKVICTFTFKTLSIKTVNYNLSLIMFRPLKCESFSRPFQQGGGPSIL